MATARAPAGQNRAGGGDDVDGLAAHGFAAIDVVMVDTRGEAVCQDQLVAMSKQMHDGQLRGRPVTAD